MAIAKKPIQTSAVAQEIRNQLRKAGISATDNNIGKAIQQLFPKGFTGQPYTNDVRGWGSIAKIIISKQPGLLGVNDQNIDKVQKNLGINIQRNTPSAFITPQPIKDPYLQTPSANTQQTPGRTLPELMKLRDAQVRAFGSADPGLEKEITALQSQPQPAPTGPQPNPQPQTNPGTNPTNPLVQAYTDFNPSAKETIKHDRGGIEGGVFVGGRDEAKLLAEAELAKTLKGQTLDAASAERSKRLDDLSGILIKQQKAQLEDSLPDIYEDLNTRGLLRSSALGDRVSKEQGKLARLTSEQLALQGLQDRDADINSRIGLQDTYLSGREGAIARRFSLEDYENQFEKSKQLGALMTPTQPSTPSAKGGMALQGGLGGAGIGASVGGPPGAAIGGLAGIMGGSAASGK